MMSEDDVVISEASYGPAFSSLTEKQKRFVLANASAPFESAAEWARMAGYSDAKEGCKVRASILMADERVRDAILEVAKAHLGTTGPAIAAQELIRIAGDRKHKDQMKALLALADRVGLPKAPAQVEVTHRHLTGEALVERIRGLATKLGLDPQKLLASGGSDIPVPSVYDPFVRVDAELAVIDAEAIEATEGTNVDEPSEVGGSGVAGEGLQQT